MATSYIIGQFKANEIHPNTYIGLCNNTVLSALVQSEMATNSTYRFVDVYAAAGDTVEDALEMAFDMANTLPNAKGGRVGDIFRVGDDHYLAMGNGFRKIEPKTPLGK